MKLADAHGRIATYLRIGVTDRCNLRCRYCMPEEGIDFADRSDLLSYEEIIRLSAIFRRCGIEKVRLTGGEPFVRKDIGNLLRSLSAIFPRVHITTNATLLTGHFELLSEIGISGLNISIDSLNRDRFFMITRRDRYDTVLSNIKKCLEYAIPVKLNVVVMKGVNDDEIQDFIEFGISNDVEVRFIEAMPFNEDDGNRKVFMPESEIALQVSQAYPDLQKVNAVTPSSSNIYSINGKYQFGIIPAYTRSLCGMCNRLRLTPQGELLTCLYSKSGLDLRNLLREHGLNDENIIKEIAATVSEKSKSGFEEESSNEIAFRSMTTIGG